MTPSPPRGSTAAGPTTNLGDTSTILPGPNPTAATAATALRVLTGAAENIMRIDVDALRAFIVAANIPITDSTWRVMQAAARFRIALVAAAAAQTGGTAVQPRSGSGKTPTG